MAVSTAVGTEIRTKVLGYQVLAGSFEPSTPNLPQSIAIFGQANTDKQSGLSTTPREVFSADEAGEIYGFGSQIHSVMRILRPAQGGIVGGIPTIIYPQIAPTTAPAAQTSTITVAGISNPADPANADATHVVEINGRSNYDGSSLEIPISNGDTPVAVAQRIADAINNARSCPVSATVGTSPNDNVVTLTTKWQGENSAGLNIVVKTDGTPANLSYAIVSTVTGAGDSSAEITASLNQFGERWNTIVINSYGKARNGLFEAFNGVAGATTPTGRYASTVFKPFVALFGSKIFDTVANVTADLNTDQNTAVQCPAPNSTGWDHEAAANYAYLMARQAQENPQLDIVAQDGGYLPDMPIPDSGNVGVYQTVAGRNTLVKAGASTVVLEGTRYRIKDFVTTYAPSGIENPSFSYVRDLILDWNVAFGYFIRQEQNVVDRVILNDDATANPTGSIKPGQWRSILVQYFQNLETRGILADVDFSRESLQVAISTTNPNRFETFFRYRRTGFARVLSTTTEAGFNFG